MLRAKFARLPLHNGIAHRSPDMPSDNLSKVIRLIRFYSRRGEIMLTHLLRQLSLRRLAPLFLAAAICMPLHTSSARVAVPVSPTQPTIMAAPGAGQACVLYQNTKGLGCRDAVREEAEQLAAPRDGRGLRVIS